MKKQYAIPLVLFFLGMAVTIIGALFKIMHWPGASITLTLGMLTEAAAIIVLITILLRNMK